MTDLNLNLADERIAWLAIRDQLQKQSKKGVGTLLVRLVGAAAMRRGGRGVAGEITNDRMRKYAIAADELVNRFSKEERATLRRTGQVPAWYLDAVLVEAKTIKF